ncbi:lipocalin family protein [Trueperella pyogenes]|uniref:lipocalin family protein n=1 Tax=Trueperella pyogenes TaxID=1661 RepID=UPI00215BBF36|nr:lipocalin family protein [Trueperella pyogenes]UVJ59706.1 lipocalin family protein [Trueperella pyogenes]
MTERVVHSVQHLDLEKYLGLWYEIARLPLKWEDAHATNITARYSLKENGKIRVDNRSFDNDGAPGQAIAEATPVDGEPGQLTVNFLPKYIRWIPFTSGDYWVLKIDDDYQVALVGTPNHENLWVLAREPQIAEETLAEYLAEARAQGFQLDKLIRPVHDGRVVTDDLVKDADRD